MSAAPRRSVTRTSARTKRTGTTAPASKRTLKVKVLTTSKEEAALEQLKSHAGDEYPDEFIKIVEDNALDLFEPTSRGTSPMIYRLLGAEGYLAREGKALRLRYNMVSERVSEYLMTLYYSKFRPTDFDYVGDSKRRPMLSQKGRTCVSDAFYTILFESEVLKPYMEAIKESAGKYEDFISTGVCAGFARHERINFTQRERRLSIENNLWEKGHEKFADPGGGILISAMRSVFWNLFIENMYGVPALEESRFVTATLPSRASSKDTSTTAAQLTEFKNSFAFLVGYESMNMNSAEKGRHAIGYMKNGGRWYILDNEVGFIHQVQDNDWFENIFMQRLDFSVNHYNSLVASNAHGSIADIEKRVFVRAKRTLDDLKMDYMTLGARCYPNEYQRFGLFTFEERHTLWTPYQIVYISEKGAGAGAGAGGARGSTRKLRNH